MKWNCRIFPGGLCRERMHTVSNIQRYSDFVLRGSLQAETLRAEMKDGQIADTTFFTDRDLAGALEATDNEAAAESLLWNVVMWIALGICGFVSLSMWLQRNDEE